MTPQVLEEAVCAGCGEAAVRILHQRRSDLHAEGAFLPSTDVFGAYGRVARCVRCGLVRLSPRPEWAFLQRAYQESEDPLYLEELEGRMVTARGLLGIVARHVPAGRLLDVGCGAGILLAAAAPRWQATGVELSRWAVKEARERQHAEVIEGTLEDAGLPDGAFDAVTVVDVIEHVPDPRGMLRGIHRVLKAGGAVFVLTPDLGAPVARAMGSWWWGFRPAHLYYFSKRTLTEMLGQEGFAVREIRRVGRRFTLGYWVSRMRGYAPAFVGLAGRCIRALRLDRLLIHVNSFDSIGVVAVKR